MLSRLDFSRPRTIVLAALILGIAAGLAGAVFHTVATEPRIEDAIDIEEAAAEADHAMAGEEPGDDGEDQVSVSRSDQRGAGLFLAYAATGAAFGLFLAVTSMSLRTTTGGPFRRVAVSGLVLAGAITVAPWLKYPPNPPAVGDPDSVGERERLFVLLVVLAALLLAGLAHLSARLRATGWTDHRRVAAVVAAGLVTSALLFAALPASPDPVPVPANLVWQFRLNSLTGNLLVWTLLTIGLGVVWSEATSAARSPAAAGGPGPADPAAPRSTGRADQNSMPFSAGTPAS